MTDMTPTTDLQKLLAEATKGPWRVRIGTRDDQDTCDIQICGDIYVLADLNGPQYAHQHPNARLIAMAPELAARVIELEADNARLREGLNKIAFERCEYTTGEDHSRAIWIARAALNGGEI